jgi:hypothetical protein
LHDIARWVSQTPTSRLILYFVILVAGWQIVQGVTVKKVGIPKVLELEFSTEDKGTSENPAEAIVSGQTGKSPDATQPSENTEPSGTISPPKPASPQVPASTPELSNASHVRIENVRQSARGPVWGYESFNDDEIVIIAQGSSSVPLDGSKFALVAFWRLVSARVTNWHVGRRSVGSNWRLATLEGANAGSGAWHFAIGGIECDKSYAGDILVVILAMNLDAIEKNETAWMDDNNGWGFEELPTGQSIAVSAPYVFGTAPVRQ